MLRTTNHELSSLSVMGPAIRIALAAGKRIMEVYSQDFRVRKKNDKSPLTVADKRSHEIICRKLTDLQVKFPVLSEEGRNISYEERRHWEYFWLVDPLDGTKEFIKRNGEFTVNIALIRKDRPVVGIIYVPVRDVCYFAAEGLGAFKVEKASKVIAVKGEEAGVKHEGSGLKRKELSVRHEEKTARGGLKAVIPAKAGIQEKLWDSILNKAANLPLPKEAGRPCTVVASRSHMSKETEEYLDTLKAEHGEMELVSAGSSLKFCLVAEGRADFYPRLGPTMEWDTAAGQCIAGESGMKTVSISDGELLRYNKEDLRNAPFVCGKADQR